MTEDDDSDEVESLEREVAAAMIERLPELQAFLAGRDAWVVARRNDLALYISIEAEGFGVGFLDDEWTLVEADLYPTPELAAAAFLSIGGRSQAGH